MACSSLIGRFLVSFVICLCFLAACFKIKAATLPPGFTETQINTSLSDLTAMEFAPDGRLFVCQQGGQLRVIKNGSLLSTPFVSLNVDADGERGLLGLAFDPNFATNHFIYLYYTPGTSSPRQNRVSRFTANGDVAVANSEVVILTLDSLSSFTNHNGGAIHFSPDGKLYVAVGENANAANSQTLTNRLGKVLRINSDGSIPTDNPFFNTATGLNRSIWSLGLRNPYTFAFQRTTGRMFINDVGQNTWEEINDGIAGSNYGWPTTEGPTNDPNFRAPIFAYQHTLNDLGGCAITGGAFYDPVTTQFPNSYVGKYFFADFCNGWIRVVDPATSTATGFATGINFPVDLRVASDGSLYYLARGGGVISRILYTATQDPPTIFSHPANRTVAQAQPVTFQVGSDGTPPLSYQWQRNTVPIPGANSPTYIISSATLSDNGARFRCVVSNASGTATSNEATLTVTAPPSITIEPSNQIVTEGQPATFQVGASGSTPLSYQWHRNMGNISGANSPTYTISSATPADNGAKFRCVVSNVFGTTTSTEATLTVTPPPPTLFAEESTDLAIAFDSVTMMRDPFPLFATFNFSSDHRSRITFFALNADLLPGESSSALTAQAEDSILVVYPLTVEFVGKVPGYDWLTQIVVKLPETISRNGDVLVNVTLHGKVSNKVRIKIR